MPEFPPNLIFSVLAFVSFLLAGLPLPWHIHSCQYMGICMYMLWISLGCLILFVNSIVWNNNVKNSAPVWCDISARFFIGAGVGVPASSLCIVRRLYYMTKLQTISIAKEERIRAAVVDVSIGIGFPCIVMALQYVVQGHRFMILEQIGCYPYTTNTLAAYFLVAMWSLVIGLISLVYAVLTFRRAFQQKERLKRLLHAGFFISAGHYWRLMAVCTTEIIFTVPLSIYTIVMDALTGVSPYMSWAWMHSDFSLIPQYPTVLWESDTIQAISLESSRWMYILCAVVIFAFFGWSEEARDFYRQAFWSVFRSLGYSKRHLSMPAQACARHHSESLQTPLEFEAPPRQDSLSSSSRLSEHEGSIEAPPRLPALNSLARYTKISWESLIAVPEAVLCRDRRSLQDVGRLV